MNTTQNPVPIGLRIISLLSALLVILLASASFTLSFDALKELASQNGFKPGFAPLFPLIIDGAIVVFSLSALRLSLHQESCRYPMFLVVIATGSSICFNMAHALEEPLAQVMASIPPLALFLSFEQLMRQIRSGARKSAELIELAQLRGEVERLERRRDELSRPKKAPKQGEKPGSTDAAMLSKANSTRRSQLGERRLRVAELLEQGREVAEIAEILGVSRRTIKRDIEVVGDVEKA